MVEQQNSRKVNQRREVDRRERLSFTERGTKIEHRI